MTAPLKHIWIANRAFDRLTGIAKVCMDCGFAVRKGQTLTVAEKVCPGKRPT